MIGSFIDKTKGLLDPHFFQAWWSPTLFSFLVGLLIYSWPNGWEPLQQYLFVLNSGEYTLDFFAIFGMLFVTFVLAYLIQSFSHPLIQFWEGYWPSNPQNLYNILQIIFYILNNRRVKGLKNSWNKIYKKRDESTKKLDESTKKPDELIKKLDELLKKFDELLKSQDELLKSQDELLKSQDESIKYDQETFARLHEKLFYEYPKSEDRFLPTRLGNVLRSAEDYGKNTYGMQTVFWWPRLWLILPQDVRQEIEESQTPMYALLNLLTQIVVVSFFGAGYLVMQVFQGNFVLWGPVVVIFGGLLFSYFTYRGAVSYAKTYGMLVRSAVDLYHLKLLEVLHQPMPKNLSEEITAWDNLIKWTYYYDRTAAPSYAHQDKPPETPPAVVA